MASASERLSEPRKNIGDKRDQFNAPKTTRRIPKNNKRNRLTTLFSCFHQQGFTQLKALIRYFTTKSGVEFNDSGSKGITGNIYRG